MQLTRYKWAAREDAIWTVFESLLRASGSNRRDRNQQQAEHHNDCSLDYLHNILF